MDLRRGESGEEGWGKPRALFLFPDRPAESDAEVCSGAFPSHLEGKACPFSDAGRFPLFAGSSDNSEGVSALTPRAFDMLLACIIQNLGPVKAWRAQALLKYPKRIEDCLLFKCRQMFLLVIPGISGPSSEKDYL